MLQALRLLQVLQQERQLQGLQVLLQELLARLLVLLLLAFRLPVG
ncbi:hypothetical protein GCM10007205_28290 [Oxalicibacterium flavum]|uniref:Uncharacterized protein n=1 Tax=Oxalicibacterium flavum TaxID=179467 RepID=A0A8J2XVP1_9BURK|nr:hypothetical protein GCM10007205_28290 [Oxalicibacterium flavum]